MLSIYLHGFASSPASRKAQFFAERATRAGHSFRVPALDDGDFEHLTITGMLRLVEQEMAGEPVILIGSSLGGYLAALLASRHEQVKKVVLMAPAFHLAERWQQRTPAADFDRWQSDGSLEYFHYGTKTQRRLHWGFLEDARRYEAEPEIAQPTLLFHGDRDEVVPLSDSLAWSIRHPNAHLQVLTSDHELGDQLDLLWRESSAFLYGADQG
jgi:hypothetical protein